MCEHCQAGTRWESEPEADDFACEYSGGTDQSAFCPNLATVMVSERYVEEHVCVACAARDRSRIAERHGNSGVENRLDYLPIARNPPRCHRCGAVAVYAKMVVEDWFYCEEHKQLA